MTGYARHLAALGVDSWPHPEGHVEIRGRDPVLHSRFHIGEAAAVALALGGATAAEIHRRRGAPPADVTVEVGHATASLLGFALQSRLDGKEGADLKRTTPATVGFFETADGRSIHLHGGFPALHERTLSLLDCADGAGSIAAALARRDALELEDALAGAGLCGAVARTPDEWDAHPQGRALRTRPVVSIERIGDAPAVGVGDGPRPLSGVRVLDLTRVLAGPTSGRTLAQYGADVLRIGADRLPTIAPFVSETGHGKRSAFLDLDVPGDVSRLRALVAGADVFIDGYRSGALDARGFSAAELATLRPGIVSVSIRCYGDHGPWASRRGWEQLAQSATGIACLEGAPGPPRLIPAAATDYTTGYLAAYGALEALRRRATEGGSWRVEVSLCRTGMWLRDLNADLDPADAQGLPPLDTLLARTTCMNQAVRHVPPAVSLSTSVVAWRRPATALGSDRAQWLEPG